MEDKKLIAGCLQHKRAFQKILYDSHRNKMYSICLRYLKDKDLANEALQRGFIKVFEKLSSFKINSSGSLGGWIRSIIVFTAIDLIKERKKLLFDDIENIPSKEVYSDDNYLNYQNVDYPSLLDLLDELPLGYRTVFSMYVLDEIKHDEIASILKISVATSRSQLHKAKKMLKEKVEKNFGNAIIEKI